MRVFPDPKTGLYQIEWREDGRRLTRSLKHRDWVRAKRQADEAAAGFAVHEPNGKAEPEPAPLTLGLLFDIYGEEVTPTKGKKTRGRDRYSTEMFLGFFGRDRNPATLSQRDWDRFIRERRAGRAGPSGQPVRNRTIDADLTFLMAVLNWAARSRDDQGRLLLDRNPLKGLRKPTAKNPARVLLTEEEYHAMLGVSRQINWRFHVALVLAHETGHRIGAIRQLRWSDIDFEGKTIRWRAKHEKTGYEHVTPMTDEADPSRCMDSSWAYRFWCRAQTRAGLEPKLGRGWHSLRRKFASDLMDLPLKVLCQLGGWKNAHTVLRCYQRADEGQLREALESRRRVQV